MENFRSLVSWDLYQENLNKILVESTYWKHVCPSANNLRFQDHLETSTDVKSNTWNWICPKSYSNGKLLTFHADHDDFFKFLSIWLLQIFISPSVLTGYIFEWQDDPTMIQAWSAIRLIMVIIGNTFIIDSFCLFTTTNLISLEFSLTQRTAAYVGIILVLQWDNWWLYFTFELV